MKSMPSGAYIQLPDPRFATSFVCMGPNDGATLVVATAAWNSHQQWELAARLKRAGVHLRCTRRAKREVIEAVHHQYLRQQETATEQTNTEKGIFSLIDRAVQARASDIHIETRGSHAQVLFRIDGERVWQEDITTQSATEMCNTLYSFHGEKNSKEVDWNVDTVKEGVIEHETRGKDKKHVQLRFESTPIHPASDKNFQAVIRLLLMEMASRPLEEVGYLPQQIAVIEEMLLGAQGMVVLVGPTNSGKSTSMQALMQRLFEMRGPTIKAVTVEDPVEYVIPGACQMGVPKRRKDLNQDGSGVFNAFLKATLRLDPDVVLVGEIRDAESAGNTKNLVLAGRKLLSTLHVYEAFAVFERLKELGVPTSVLYMEGFISGVIYQRLVPQLCPHCSIRLVDGLELVAEALRRRVERVQDYERDNVRLRSRGGCGHCDHKGIIGRLPCAELLVPDATLLSYLREGDERRARTYWHSQGRLNVAELGVTAVAHAIQLMRQGQIDPRDIEAQIGPIVVYRSAPFDSDRAVPLPISRSTPDYGFGGGRFGGASLESGEIPARLVS